jgi:uncharacterized repeat protein (TIGR03803 family)
MYGTTYNGGANNLGVAFALTVFGDAYKVIDSAPGGSGSAHFAAAVTLLNNNLTSIGRCTGKCGGVPSAFGGPFNLGDIIGFSTEYELSAAGGATGKRQNLR